MHERLAGLGGRGLGTDAPKLQRQFAMDDKFSALLLGGGPRLTLIRCADGSEPAAPWITRRRLTRHDDDTFTHAVEGAFAGPGSQPSWGERRAWASNQAASESELAHSPGLCWRSSRAPPVGGS